MTQDKTPDFEHDVGDMRELEAKCPNTVRFFRELVKGGPVAQEATKHVKDHVELEELITRAVENRIPAGIILMVLAELCEPRFKDGVRRCSYEPIEAMQDEAIRTYVQKYFAEVKGVQFDYKDLGT